MATLKAKQKDLKAKELGSKPRTSDSLTDEEIEKLYASKWLGIESPQAFINTLWLNSTIHSGLRGGKEQRELRWGDVKLKQTPDGKEYLEYSVERLKEKFLISAQPCNIPFDAIKLSPERLVQLQTCTAQDPVLMTLKTTVITGWPELEEQVPVPIRKYWL